MYYKIVLSNSKQTIPVESEEDVKAIFADIQKGSKLIVAKNGVFNPSFLVAILQDREMWDDMHQYGEAAPPMPSLFAKIFAEEMKMISDKERTSIQEDVARIERR